MRRFRLLGVFSLGKRRLREILLMCTNMRGGNEEEGDTDFSQWCPLTVQEATGIN